MSSQTLSLLTIGLALVIGLFLFLGWILMLLVNVVLAHYNVQQLDYGSALAIEGLVVLFLGGRAASN